MCINGGFLDLNCKAAAAWPASEAERMRRTSPAHHHIFFEGDKRTHVYIVESGWVKLYRTLIDGQRQAVAFYDHGAILGLEGGAEHVNSCEAITPVTMTCVPVNPLSDLCARDPAFADRVLRQLGAQLRTSQSHLTTIGAQSADQKVATFLLAMSDHDDAAAEFDLPMRRTDMGEFLGLRLETISRKIAQFRQRKWIQMTSMYRCRILNRGVLEALAAGGDAVPKAA